MRYYGNHNDYSLSPLRGLAHGHYNQYARMSEQANNKNIQAMKDMSKGYHPDAAAEKSLYLASVTPEEQAASDAHRKGAQAWQTAMGSEGATVQDRQMDLAENNLAMNSADRRYEAALQNDAMKYTADANRIPGFQGAGNVGNPLQGLYANAPNINLYDNQGNRIGGSYYNS
jgi:hypothetical protein